MANKKKRLREGDGAQADSPLAHPAAETRATNMELSLRAIPPQIIVCGAVLLAGFVWSYWPTLVELVHLWNKEPDYSHGFLVLPIALAALWMRRDQLDLAAIRWSWWGLVLVGISAVLRYFGAVFYVSTVDGWSMLLWIAGVCWVFAGWKFFKWVLPGVAFLVFMVPLPHFVERALRLPLQQIATKFSCAILQSLGQPALAERNVIMLGDHRLEVEEACAGLRIFVTIAVLAAAYILIVRPVWWERLVLVLAIVPIALMSNALRIVITGLLYELVSSKASQKFSHDLAGWLMIPLAAAMFGLVLWYLSNLFKEVEVISRREAMRQSPA